MRLDLPARDSRMECLLRIEICFRVVNFFSLFVESEIVVEVIFAVESEIPLRDCLIFGARLIANRCNKLSK